MPIGLLEIRTFDSRKAVNVNALVQQNKAKKVIDAINAYWEGSSGKTTDDSGGREGRCSKE